MMEESDVIVKLNQNLNGFPKTGRELADKIKLSKNKFEYGSCTQPIEMRFNELISGTRSDVAIKILVKIWLFLAQKS
jgi:cobalt-zinc-cadmium resistance protein CzcA